MRAWFPFDRKRLARLMDLLAREPFSDKAEGDESLGSCRMRVNLAGILQYRGRQAHG